MLGLAHLMERAADHPLYRGWDFSGIVDFADERWQILPTLNRERLRDLPCRDEEGPARLFYSSGTTDRPKIVCYSPADLDRVAELCARFARLEGVGDNSRVMVLLPMGLWTVGKITVDGHRRAGAEVFPVDLHGGMAAWQRMADLIRPTVISSTPSVLGAWAPHYAGPPMELIETTGEPLLSRERQVIEARFGAFVHDAYGLSECVVGTECKVRDGFHYWPDATGVEVLNLDSDLPLGDGETGELVLTSFMQEHMPILRYRSGDRGRIEPVPCPCGHAGPRVRLEGRIADTLILPRAVKIEHDELATTLRRMAPGARFRYKGVPGSPAAPFVEGMFCPLLEVILPAAVADGQNGLRDQLVAAFPEVAELIQEGELELSFVVDDTMQKGGETAV